jgi:hypothetical protein
MPTSPASSNGTSNCVVVGRHSPREKSFLVGSKDVKTSRPQLATLLSRTVSGASFVVPAAPSCGADKENVATPTSFRPIGQHEADKDLLAPSPLSTPTSARRSQRRSKFLTPRKKTLANVEALENLESGLDNSAASNTATTTTAAMGCGRAIPVRQGYLLKKKSGGNGFSRGDCWKKKYVSLGADATLTYHASLQVILHLSENVPRHRRERHPRQVGP